MPRKPIKQTMKELAAQAEGSDMANALALRGKNNEPIAPLYRREQAIRKACEICGDPLVGLANLCVAATDAEFKAAIYRAMLPYVHAQMKAVEVSGPGGEQLVIEVKKIESAPAQHARPPET